MFQPWHSELWAVASCSRQIYWFDDL